jgi:hypothetical protein
MALELMDYIRPCVGGAWIVRDGEIMPYQMLSVALAAAMPGDTIVPSLGVHSGSYVLPDGVHMQARIPWQTTFKCDLPGCTTITTGNDCQIDGICVDAPRRGIGVLVTGEQTILNIRAQGTRPRATGVVVDGGVLTSSKIQCAGNWKTGVLHKAGTIYNLQLICDANEGPLSIKSAFQAVAVGHPCVMLNSRFIGVKRAFDIQVDGVDIIMFNPYVDAIEASTFARGRLTGAGTRFYVLGGYFTGADADLPTGYSGENFKGEWREARQDELFIKRVNMAEENLVIP